MMFLVFDIFALYSAALHTSLALVQGFSLMITTHNSTASKVNGITEDILFVVFFGQSFFVCWWPDTVMPIIIIMPYC